jgi:hypothetical protein
MHEQEGDISMRNGRLLDRTGKPISEVSYDLEFFGTRGKGRGAIAVSGQPPTTMLNASEATLELDDGRLIDVILNNVDVRASGPLSGVRYTFTFSTSGELRDPEPTK